MQKLRSNKINLRRDEMKLRNEKKNNVINLLNKSFRARFLAPRTACRLNEREIKTKRLNYVISICNILSITCNSYFLMRIWATISTIHFLALNYVALITELDSDMPYYLFYIIILLFVSQTNFFFWKLKFTIFQLFIFFF